MVQTQAVRDIKSRLSGLKRGRRFIDYRESGPFAVELERLLDEINRQAESPRQGVELITAFIETDSAVLDRADDSDGSIGGVYRVFACDSFVGHASRCDDKEWLHDLVLRLYMRDEYGVRDSLISSAVGFLPEAYLQRMVGEFWALAARESDEIKRYHWYLGIEAVARQLKDPALFEKACRAKWPELPAAGHLDIAQVYFESGYAMAALQWLEKVPPGERFMIDEREQLLLKVASELGDQARAEEVAWRIFRRSRSEARLSLLLDVIGYKERERVIEGEIATLMDAPGLNLNDTQFMMEAERFDDAERYIADRSTQLNGDLYTTLLPWAKTFEARAIPRCQPDLPCVTRLDTSSRYFEVLFTRRTVLA